MHLPRWLRKSLVVLITTLTFGLVTPPASLLVDEAKADDSSVDATVVSNRNEKAEEVRVLTREEFVQQTMEKAVEQSYEKFGEKILPVIEDEFHEVILPRIEEVLISLAEQYPEEKLVNLVITEKPSGGIGEKIFHIYDKTSGKDIVRFHVRRDHPPQDGYWFNFHYHTYHDSFQTHYELGRIYWAKNTPPKWMS
ncbi:YpjP-like protein [Anoxybacillus vitaminiphilus]|uniref:YpjP-like protein n=1 Tax=Paranoxybacillus vitaminiphilus TaxID=581036 RepID=A0A327YFB9_9BACL|nr:YpjP family protein [Anoxybacillus vitaminiphilus]RAK18892.1 YpjP-like protein [Anoxybacillus vitaminiphilus]